MNNLVGIGSSSSRKSSSAKSHSHIFEVVSQRLGKGKKTVEKDFLDSNKLPDELFLDSFIWLNETEICLSAALVCKSWCVACSGCYIWKPLFEARFLENVEDCSTPSSGFKQAYINRLHHPMPGDGLEVAWHGKFRLENQSTFYGLSWWEATIVETDVQDATNPRYKVHYPGWNARWDEWVVPSRLRWPLPSSATKGLRKQPGACPLQFEDSPLDIGEGYRANQRSQRRFLRDEVYPQRSQRESTEAWQDPFSEIEDVGPGNLLRPTLGSCTKNTPLEFAEWLAFHDQRSQSSLSRKWALFGSACNQGEDVPPSGNGPLRRDPTSPSGSVKSWKESPSFRKINTNARSLGQDYVVEVWCTGTRVKGAWLEARICTVNYDRVRVRDFADKSQVFWTSWCNVRPVRTKVITGEQVERKALSSQPSFTSPWPSLRRMVSLGRELPSTMSARAMCSNTNPRNCVVS
mmetsp:Transcript_451/g.591  ORF Transcript_451/g.591 Transcript_451/m.591 type:complete len:462 (-) Transcript_451:390-1775(-)